MKVYLVICMVNDGENTDFVDKVFLDPIKAQTYCDSQPKMTEVHGHIEATEQQFFIDEREVE